MPINDLFGVWVVALKQPARDFWETTPKQYTTIFAAYERLNGLKQEGLSRNDYLDLVDRDRDLIEKGRAIRAKRKAEKNDKSL